MVLRCLRQPNGPEGAVTQTSFLFATYVPTLWEAALNGWAATDLNCVTGRSIAGLGRVLI